ncbi:PspA/IM30 family protein [hydrothermal vent metagenome]|uniref:PspA/IM30 family protein n=1 Tax=hydrothermal vent metagenome TaxID=652676 RepID=A0A3B1BP59_9ZZZZ
MSIFKKLVTAVRGGATEVGEAIIDTQAIRILEQELRDAKKALNDAKTNLTAIMAEKMGVSRKVNELSEKIKEHEGYAMQALDKNDESLATDVANKISEFEYELNIQQGILDGYETKITSLKKMIRQTERNIQAMDREISVVKTTEKVQKANDLAAAKFSGSNSSLRSATDSLERIKARQQKREDQATAALELESEDKGDDLQARLKNAGIVDSASSGSSVLERLKKQKENS